MRFLAYLGIGAVGLMMLERDDDKSVTLGSLLVSGSVFGLVNQEVQ